MTQFAHVTAEESNRAAYKWHVDFCWRDLFKQLFPDNTAACVASFTKTSVGAAEHVMRGRNGPSQRALINLLRSPIGQRVLDAIVGDVDWRAMERRRLDIAKLEHELDQLEQKRRELARAIDAPR